MALQQVVELAEPLAHSGMMLADLVDARRGGRSCATPPGRMYAWFIRRPVISSKSARIRSRSRKPTVMTVVAPISMPPVASTTRWEVIRLSSIMQHADDAGPLGDLRR